ncbi:MAG: aminotransferase class I/II-fold pyridoxal phosphate-dependent enzyme [Phycisphaerae bacterium]
MSALWERIEADPNAMRQAGQFKRLQTLTGPMGPTATLAGAGECVVLCSNDYLGLANDPACVEAGRAAMARYGAGTGSVRFICGTFDYHARLERRLAELSATETATTYVSCWNANEAVLPTLMSVCGGDCVVISDELNHASIIDAIRLGRQINKQSQSRIYRHCDLADLEAALQEFARTPHRIVVTDGVFSMEGSLAPLDRIAKLCRDHAATLVVDDSHGVGVTGPTGRGTAEHFGLHGQVDIVTGTLGKTLGGAAGGYVAGPRPLIELLVQKSRPQIFSNALPPATAAIADKAVEILLAEPQRVARLRDNVAFLRAGLRTRGFEIGDAPSAITPIILGQTSRAIAASQRLLELGVFVIGFGYPVVPEGKARLRVQVSAAHRREHLERALDAFSRL